MALKQCSMCDRTFTKLEHLKRHERSHTKERPYECPTCNKSFSRSDVLFRHCKGHNQVAMNRRKEYGDQGHKSLPLADGASDTSQFHLTGHMTGPTPAPSLQGGDVPLPESINSSVVHANSGHRMEALINAAQHLEPAAYTSWQSPNSMHPDNYQMTGHHDSSLGPPIDPSMESLSFSPTGNVGNFDPWTFDMVQNHQSVLGQTPSNSLRSWLFPPESNMDTPSGVRRPEIDGMIRDAAAVNSSNDQGSLSDAMSIASKIPRERFARVANCWPPQISRTTRIMPILWQDLTTPGCPNILSDEAAHTVEQHYNQDERRNSRWCLDEQGRISLQNILTQPPPNETTILNHRSSLVGTNSAAATGSSMNVLQFPPTEILDIALEMYLTYSHPTLPIIHVPTFSTKQVSRPLLLSMCLIGLSILGTAGAVRFVTQSFPSLLQLVLSDLRSLRSSEDPPQRHMRTIATGLLALSLASITGRKNRIAQAEELYIELLTVSQNQGLFSVNDGTDVDALLNSLDDKERKWKAWINIECVKRITYGLIQADCWWAGHLSSSPIIRPELVQVYPVTNQTLYQADSSTAWYHLVKDETPAHVNAITPFPHLAPAQDLNLTCNQLTLISLRMCEASDRLGVKDNHQHLEPWRIFAEDERSRGIVPLVVSFRSITDLNSIVLWHNLCMKLGANMQHFELAAGRGGAGPAAAALEHISTWSQSATARRSILHAAHIYKLLSDRKVSDIVHPHSIVALFQAALVLGLYIFTVAHSINVDHTHSTNYELSDLVDWVSIGALGLADLKQPSGTSGIDSAATQFIKTGGSLSLANGTLEGGYAAARKTLLHCADLMEGMGRWKSTTFSQILHIMSDDLTEFNGPDHDED